MATELGLHDVVTFTGFRSDGARVMSAVDVFTLASKWEGLPVALMEALALGLPVVATAVGGVAETMGGDAGAALVPPGDAAALAEGWRAVFADPERRAVMAAATRARAAEFDAARAQLVIEAAYLGDDSASPPEPVQDVAPAGRARVPSPGIDIRPATAADRPAILQLLQRSMGRDADPRFAELFRWKHDLNAFGPSPTWVAIADDRVVAVRVFMRWEFLRGGQVLRAVRAVDTATDPDHQGKGLFTALTMHGLEEMAADGVDFVFNTPNAQSKPGYLKMGWREVGRVPTVIRPSGPFAAVGAARSRTAADQWSQPIEIGRRFSEWADGRTGWRTAGDLPIRTLATHTTEAFDRWRFGWDELNYRVLDHGEGAIVVRARRRGRSLELVHAATFGLSTAAADRVVVRSMREVGAQYAIRIGRPNLRAGFMPVPGGGPMLTWRSINAGGLPPLSNWSFTTADVELF